MTKPNKKDFLVRLSSLKDELAHRAPMFLKSEKRIVRQISVSEAGKVKMIGCWFGTQSSPSISITSPTAPQVLFHGRKSTPKGLVKFSALNQGRFYSLLLTKSLKFIPEFYPESIDQVGFLKRFHPTQINHQTKKTIQGRMVRLFRAGRP
ncbi:hypothetical protein [Vibrio rhizosphaerae]|uniref:hypothetical protein n=1 Tax=Vibrio rhizosphaerae TaxID=398736 RepID=UPI0021C3080C|nr:hypothetical protein [Vibrio rhizosphaerae]